MAQQKKILGPRATVEFISSKGRGQNKPVYVYMLKSVANKLGFSIIRNPTITRKPSKKQSGGKEIKVVVRGSSGAKHIKVPLPGTTNSTNKRKGSGQKYLQVPVPATANLTDIKAFLKRAKKKPKTFVSPDGRVHPVDSE